MLILAIGVGNFNSLCCFFDTAMADCRCARPAAEQSTPLPTPDQGIALGIELPTPDPCFASRRPSYSPDNTVK